MGSVCHRPTEPPLYRKINATHIGLLLFVRLVQIDPFDELSNQFIRTLDYVDV